MFEVINVNTLANKRGSKMSVSVGLQSPVGKTCNYVLKHNAESRAD